LFRDGFARVFANFATALAKCGRRHRLLRSGALAVYAAHSIDIIAARRFDRAAAKSAFHD
jgi:hypothetical protein